MHFVPRATTDVTMQKTVIDILDMLDRKQENCISEMWVFLSIDVKAVITIDNVTEFMHVYLVRVLNISISNR